MYLLADLISIIVAMKKICIIIIAIVAFSLLPASAKTEKQVRDENKAKAYKQKKAAEKTERKAKQSQKKSSKSKKKK